MNPFLSDQVLPTTVVGSYPSEPRRTMRSLFDPYHEALKTAVKAQIDAGITIISDGQVRGDMIGSFASKLPGVKGNDVIGRVMPPDIPITVKDTMYAVSKHPYVKGIITGPSTLAYGLHISTPNYRNRNELIPDLAKAISVEAQALAQTGAVMIQIDEPILSTGASDLSVGIEAIRLIKKEVSIPICLHVCGEIHKIIDDILHIPVDIIDFEGSTDQKNLETLSKADFQSSYIGYGCVSSADPEVESVQTVIRRIERGIEVFGAERLLLDPDCGLRMHTKQTADAKLSRLTEAARVVRSNLGE